MARRTPKPARRRKPEPPKRAQITDTVILRARQRPGKPTPLIHPFVAANHPPSVFPEGNGTLAMDSAITTSLNWAAQQVALGAFEEGLQFLGYPYLAELAQRPEYRRISETIAAEMTRKWIRVQSTGDGDDDKADKIKKIEAELKRLHVRDAFRKVAAQDGFFGRGHLYLDLGTGEERDELKTPIGDGWDKASAAKVTKARPLLAVKAIEAVWCYPTNYNSNDPLRDDWYKPQHWFVQGKEIHASRLLTFIGREVSDLLKPAYSFGGLALSQMAKPYVDNWLRTRQSVADIIQAFSVFVLKTNMGMTLQGGGEEFFRRLDLFTLNRDNRGVMVVDKDTEDFENVAAPLGTLDMLQAQTQEHMAAVSGIPLVKLLGIQPAGLNADSEGVLRSFYDWITGYQESLFTDNLHRVLGFVQLSLFGRIDPEIGFAWEPLVELDEAEEATVRKTEAETDIALIDAGVLAPLESRKRLAADPDSPYASLDVDDLPEVEEPDEDIDIKEAA